MRPRRVCLDRFRGISRAGVACEPNLLKLKAETVFAIIAQISRDQKIPILQDEQNSKLALQYADYGYIMEVGKIVLEGTSAELRDNQDVREFYLGVGDNDKRRSFKNLKSYKRRKRWL